MNYLKNERGFTLVSVLIIIILIFSFAMILIPKSVNTAVQVGKTTGSTQTKDLAEMGIRHAHAYLEDRVAIAKTRSNSTTPYNDTNLDVRFCKNLRDVLAPINNETKMGDQQFSYQLILPTKLTTFPTDNSCTGFTHASVNVESIGKVVGKADRKILATFFIENKGALHSGGSDSFLITPEHFVNDYTITGSNITQLFSSVRFSKKVEIKGTPTLIVRGNAIFENNPAVEFSGNGGKLVISGNAYFRTTPTMNGSQNQYICIRGDAFLWNNGSWVPNTQIEKSKLCPPSVGIIDYSYDLDHWGVIDAKLDVIY